MTDPLAELSLLPLNTLRAPPSPSLPRQPATPERPRSAAAAYMHAPSVDELSEHAVLDEAVPDGAAPTERVSEGVRRTATEAPPAPRDREADMALFRAFIQ